MRHSATETLNMHILQLLAMFLTLLAVQARVIGGNVEPQGAAASDPLVSEKQQDPKPLPQELKQVAEAVEIKPQDNNNAEKKQDKPQLQTENKVVVEKKEVKPQLQADENKVVAKEQAKPQPEEVKPSKPAQPIVISKEQVKPQPEEVKQLKPILISKEQAKPQPEEVKPSKPAQPIVISKEQVKPRPEEVKPSKPAQPIVISKEVKPEAVVEKVVAKREQLSNAISKGPAEVKPEAIEKLPEGIQSRNLVREEGSGAGPMVSSDDVQKIFKFPIKKPTVPHTTTAPTTLAPGATTTSTKAPVIHKHKHTHEHLYENQKPGFFPFPFLPHLNNKGSSGESNGFAFVLLPHPFFDFDKQNSEKAAESSIYRGFSEDLVKNSGLFFIGHPALGNKQHGEKGSQADDTTNNGDKGNFLHPIKVAALPILVPNFQFFAQKLELQKNASKEWSSSTEAPSYTDEDFTKFNLLHPLLYNKGGKSNGSSNDFGDLSKYPFLIAHPLLFSKGDGSDNGAKFEDIYKQNLFYKQADAVPLNKPEQQRSQAQEESAVLFAMEIPKPIYRFFKSIFGVFSSA